MSHEGEKRQQENGNHDHKPYGDMHGPIGVPYNAAADAADAPVYRFMDATASHHRRQQNRLRHQEIKQKYHGA